ncbi:MAG: hypothetical protein R2873_14875 [Caldilineaceae bacterium]
MPEQPHEQNGNPLDDLANDLSSAHSAKNVDVHNASVDKIHGGRISMAKSAARTIHANALDIDDSAALFVQADSLEMRDCAAAAVASNRVTMHDSTASVLVTSEAKIQDATVGVLLTGRVEGDVKAVFTPLSALAVGAGIGLALTVLQQLIGRLRRS